VIFIYFNKCVKNCKLFSISSKSWSINNKIIAIRYTSYFLAIDATAVLNFYTAQAVDAIATKVDEHV